MFPLSALGRLITLVSLTLCLAIESFAAGAADFSIHEQYYSVRAKAMGGAYSPVVEDHSAIFYNPAALARRKKGDLHLNLGAGLSPDYLGFVSDLGNTNSDPNQVTTVLQKNYGKNFYSRVPFLGGFYTRPRWGFAVIPADVSINLGVDRTVGSSLSVDAYIDTTAAYSYARNVKWGQQGLLSVGATAKAIHRVNFSEVLDVGTLAADSNVFQTKNSNEGLFADLDIGVLYTPKLPKEGFWANLRYAYPTFSAVVRNLIDMDATNLNVISKDSKQPNKLQRRLDLGTKLNFPEFWVFDPKCAVDIRDIGHKNWTFMKGLHLGCEMSWQMYSWWKGYWSAGLNQGYVSAGVGALFGWFQLDLATWGEEVGTADAKSEDRRFMIELSLDI